MMQRRLHILIVTSEVCLLCVIQSAQSTVSYCATGQYYDGVADRCIECSAICLPDVESRFCAINCPEYFNDMIKQRHQTEEAQQATEAAAATARAYNSSSTTTAVAEDGTLTVVLRLAVVCGAMAIVVMLLMVSVISCRSCQTRSDESDVTVQCGFCPPLDDIRHQHVEQTHVDVANVGHSGPADSSGSPLIDSSERRSLLPTTSLDAVSLMSSLHDDVKSPVSWTWSISTSDDRIVIQRIPGQTIAASDSKE